MSKKTKIIILVIIIIATLALVGVFAFTRSEKTEENSNNTLNNIANVAENIVEENVVSNEISNNTVVENVVSENTTLPTEENPTVELEPSKTEYQATDAYEKSSEVGTTDKKQEAINLVKEKWGPDDTVIFSCDSVTSNGEYIIAVSSPSTATVRNYFRVNLQTKEVVVEY